MDAKKYRMDNIKELIYNCHDNLDSIINIIINSNYPIGIFYADRSEKDIYLCVFTYYCIHVIDIGITCNLSEGYKIKFNNEEFIERWQI